MKKHVLFIHGAGGGAYEADRLLAENLQHHLGSEYDVLCPQMPDEENVPYADWKKTTLEILAQLFGEVFLVGHSVGASVLTKILSEEKLKTPIHGIFLIANPFWGGEGWTYDGYEELELPADFPQRLPADVPVVLYHCKDDEVVPFSHLSLYSRLIPRAKVREIEDGGHQLENDLAVVAKDIQSLM